MPKDFSGQNLRGRSFKEQDLTGADFSGADIRGTNFIHTTLIGANFEGTKTGLAYPSLFLRTITIFLFGGLSDYILIAGSQRFFMLTQAMLDVMKLSDPTIHIVVSVALMLLFAGILMMFIQKYRMWVGLMIMAIAVTIAAAMAATIETTTLSAIAGVMAMTGAMSGAGVITMTMTMTVAMIASRTMAATIIVSVVGTAFIFQNGIGAVIFLALGVYIAWKTRCEDVKFPSLREFARWFLSLGGTTFHEANLSEANFAKANLKYARFVNAVVTCTHWKGSEGLELARLDGTILIIRKDIRDLLVSGNGHGKSFIGTNLKGAYLVNADLSDGDFTEVDFSGADLQGANLQNTNLTKTVMLGVNLQWADLTGVCVEAWNIDNSTQLDGAQAEYVYLQNNRQERRPNIGTFGEGEFSKLFQEMFNTVDFIFNSISWRQ